MHDNSGYGFDPHDDSDFLTIHDNEVYNNGYHGIIASKRCNGVSIQVRWVKCKIDMVVSQSIKRRVVFSLGEVVLGRRSLVSTVLTPPDNAPRATIKYVAASGAATSALPWHPYLRCTALLIDPLNLTRAFLSLYVLGIAPFFVSCRLSGERGVRRCGDVCRHFPSQEQRRRHCQR